MSRLGTSELMLGLLILAGCQKSVSEERKEAAEAQREATEAAGEAAQERRAEVAAAREESAEDISAARREQRSRSMDAVEQEIEKTAGAQAEADEALAEVARARRDGQDDRDVAERIEKANERLTEMEKRVRELRSEGELESGERTRLGDVERELSSLRSQVLGLRSRTGDDLVRFREDVERRLDAAESALDDID